MNRTIIGLLVGTCTVGLTVWNTKFWQDQTPTEPIHLTVTLRSGVRMDGLKTPIDLLHIKTVEVTTGKTKTTCR